MPEPTASQPVPAPKRPLAPERLWAQLRVGAVRPSREEIRITFPTLGSDVQVVAVLLNRN